jgi:protein SCO1/2
MRATWAATLLVLSVISAAKGQAVNVGIDQRLNAQAPLDLAFRDERGDTVTLGKYFGPRPVILMLAYYRCPRLCSVALTNLAESLRQIDYAAGQDFAVVIVSIDPRETPDLAAAKKTAVLGHYGRGGAEAGWHFLTGDEASVRRLADAVGFRYAYDAERDLYAHASGVMVLTPDGKIARYFFGLEHTARDLRFGLEDASAGTIGSPLEQPLRLLCFAYDPDAGTYTLMTMRLVRIGGAITLLLVGLFLARAWRRERRATKQPTSVG